MQHPKQFFWKIAAANDINFHPYRCRYVTQHMFINNCAEREREENYQKRQPINSTPLSMNLVPVSLSNLNHTHSENDNRVENPLQNSKGCTGTP
ncbi:hypothetical protein CDAR_517501 [Caerostris darwini]|uniref:Uncharacterized protein n=1 Tax=Caerostris darwini TaxID=1538125 RepID=A0AAV4PKB3_9ARAC|nr:hypothetical protein CDAR_517501 [Caerostris darwini]